MNRLLQIVIALVVVCAAVVSSASAEWHKTKTLRVGGNVVSFDVSHDGEMVGLAVRQEPAGTQKWPQYKGFVYGPKKFKNDGLVELVDPRDKNFRVNAINFPPTGDKIVTWGVNETSHIWTPEVVMSITDYLRHPNSGKKPSLPETKKALGTGGYLRRSASGKRIFTWPPKRPQDSKVSPGLYKIVNVLNAFTGERVAMGIHNGEVETGAISADDNWAFSAGEGYFMKWSTNKPGQGSLGVRWLKSSCSLPDKTPVVAMDASPDGDKVGLALADGRVLLVLCPGEEQAKATPLAGIGKVDGMGIVNHAILFKPDRLVVARTRPVEGKTLQEVVESPFRSDHPNILFEKEGSPIVAMSLVGATLVAVDQTGAFGYLSSGSGGEWHWLEGVEDDATASGFVVSVDGSTIVVSRKHALDIFKNQGNGEVAVKTAQAND